jgi:hypothetical protein
MQINEEICELLRDQMLSMVARLQHEEGITHTLRSESCVMRIMLA